MCTCVRSVLAKAGPPAARILHTPPPPHPEAHSEVLLDGLFLPDSVAGGVTEVLRGRGDLFTVLQQLCTNRT